MPRRLHQNLMLFLFLASAMFGLFPAALFCSFVVSRFQQLSERALGTSLFAWLKDVPFAVPLAMYMTIILLAGTKLERSLIVAASLLLNYVAWRLFDCIHLRGGAGFDNLKGLIYPRDIAVSLISLAIFISAWRAIQWYRHRPPKPTERAR